MSHVLGRFAEGIRSTLAEKQAAVERAEAEVVRIDGDLERARTAVRLFEDGLAKAKDTVLARRRDLIETKQAKLEDLLNFTPPPEEPPIGASVGGPEMANA